MTPEAIIREAQAEGVTLTILPSGNIFAAGKDEARQRWVPIIRERKAEIIAALKTALITSCKTCVYVAGRGGCGNPVAAGLSGVIAYDVMGGADCVAYTATGSPTNRLEASPIPSHQTGRKNTPENKLEGRIYAMARRWGYSGDELAQVLKDAKVDPVGWATYCDHDEALAV